MLRGFGGRRMSGDYLFFLCFHSALSAEPYPLSIQAAGELLCY